MRLHDFLRLPFRPAVLRTYLGVSPQTFQRLLTDAPVSAAVIGRIALKLQAPDAQLQTTLAQLSLPKHKVQPPAIFPVTLPKLATLRPAVALTPAPQYYLDTVRGPANSLNIVATPASTKRERRVAHSLYADDWQAFAPYPLTQLSNTHLAAFSRSWHYHLPKNQVFRFHNYQVKLPLQAQFAPYLVVLLTLAAQTDHDLTIAIDQQCGAQASAYFEAKLETVKQFLLATRQQTLTTFLVDPADHLSLQAAKVTALATARLPQAEWHHALIDPLSGEALRKTPLVKAFAKRWPLF